MGRRLELRDLRSLERQSMYSIFHPLDPNERLPRELILEGRRHRYLEVRHLEILALLFMPTVVAVIVALGSFNIPSAVVYGIAGIMCAGFFAFFWAHKPD